MERHSHGCSRGHAADARNAVGHSGAGHTRIVGTLAVCLQSLFLTVCVNGPRMLHAEAVLADNASEAPHGHTRHVQALTFSPDGRTLISGGDDKAIGLWDVEREQWLAMGRGHGLVVSQLVAEHGGRQFASASWDGTARLWDFRGVREIRRCDAGADSLHALALSPDGTLLAAGGSHRMVTVWETATGQPVRRWLMRDDQALDLPIAADVEAKPPWTIADPVVSALAFRPDGAFLAIGTRRGVVLLQDMRGETPARVLRHGDNPGHIYWTAFSADGTRLFSAGRTVQVWNAADGQWLRDIGRPGAAHAVALAAAEERLAVSDGRHVVLLDAATGQELRTFENAGRDASAMALTPDGGRLAVGTLSGLITLWDTATGQQLAGPAPAPTLAPAAPPPPVPDDARLARALAPDQRGAWTLAADTDGLQWPADPAQGGVQFAAKGSVRHMAGWDSLWRPWPVGTRAFDLLWTVNVDHTGGNHHLLQGVCMGIATAPPERMGPDDVAVLVAVHLRGVSADVVRGSPYALRRYNDMTMRRLAGVVSGAEVPVIEWSHEALGTIGMDAPIALGIRRDARNVLTLSAWCPAAGQSETAPWWSAHWPIPDELAATELNYLFIKRIPPRTVHLGEQVAGTEGAQLTGTVIDLRAAMHPPVVTDVTWDSLILGEGARVTVRGLGFREGLTVRVGDRAAPAIEVVSAEELRVTLPDLPSGRRYPLVVELANGLNAGSSTLLPYGRMLESMQPREAPPAGGGWAELRGTGFARDTQVWFGEAEAERVELVSRNVLRVRIPSHPPGPTTVTAQTGDQRFAGDQRFGFARFPALWTGPLSLDALRAKYNDPAFDLYRGALDQAIESARAEKIKPGTHVTNQSIDALMWACVYRGEEADRERLWAWMSAEVAQGPPDLYHLLPAARGIAMAYDAIRDDLDVNDRGIIEDYLHAALDAYLEFTRARTWHFVNHSSVNPWSNAAGLIVALVVRETHPHAAEAIGHARRNLETYLTTTWTEHGGCLEGMYFAVRGLSSYLLAAHFLAHSTGEREMVDHPRLANVRRMYETLISGPASTFPFRQSNPSLRGSDICADLGSRQSDPLLLWLADDMARRRPGFKRVDGHGDGAAAIGAALLYRGPAAAPATVPPLPTLSVLPGVQWGVMRSDPALAPALIVGVKGQDGPLPYHRENDVGGFILRARGDDLLLDPGPGRPAAEQHSVPIIDGKGPDAVGGFITDAWQDGPWRAIVLDTTDAYRPWVARRVRRHFVQYGDEALIVLDDIVPAEGSDGHISAQFQTREPELRPDTAEIFAAGPNARMAIRLFGPEIDLKTQAYSRHGLRWTAVRGHYRADTDVPLVSVVSVAAADAPEPSRPAVTRDGTTLTVTLGNAKATFRHDDNGWAFAPDGAPMLQTPAPSRPIPVARAARTDTAPIIDGCLDEEVWSAAPEAGPFWAEGTWRAPADPQTEVRFLWDDSNLYVAIRCHTDPRATLVTDALHPYQDMDADDRVTLFVDRNLARKASFDRRINAAGVIAGANQRHGESSPAPIAMHVGRETARGEAGEQLVAWTIEMAVPWTTLMNNRLGHEGVRVPEAGQRMGLNVMRYRPGQESAWAYTHHSTPVDPHRWGILLFE